MQHPNAFTALITTLLTAGLLALGHRFGYADLTSDQALILAGAIITAVLFVGRRIWTEGLLGLVKTILRGAKAVAVGQQPKAAFARPLLDSGSAAVGDWGDTMHLGFAPLVPQMRVVKLHETPIRHRRLGRHVEHDPKSRDYPFLVVDAAPLRKVLWERTGRPLNQGQLGSCTGNAMAGLLNTEPFIGTRKPLAEKDAIALYAAATVLDGIHGTYPPDDTGSSGIAVCKAAVKAGYISGYRHAFSVAQALQALMQGPVITGVPWYEGFDTPDQGGLVKISGQVRGGHEFEILGYDPVTDLLEAENSWGPAYGINGRFFFTSRTWAELLADQGDVTVPVPKAAA